MIRLIVTTVIVLYFAITLAISIGSRLEMALFYKDGEPFYVGQYRGTFELLDDIVLDLDGAELQTAMHGLKTRFRVALRLVYKQELDLPAKGHLIVDSGDIYLHDLGDSAFLYRNSVLADRVWSLPVVSSALDERIAHLSGPLSLIKDKLSDKDARGRKLAVKVLQGFYDVPLSLTAIVEMDLSENDLSLLSAGQIVIKNPMESGEYFLAKLDSSEEIFQFGPIDYPSRFESQEWFDSFIFAAVALICIVFWTWPLWRDLQRLRRASLDIGTGKLDTRVRSNPVSLIRPILDSFNSMAKRTESMVEAQRELTHAVSHELRTPLARIMFDLQMARDTENMAEQARHFDSLEYNVDELSTLVDELLTYAKHERVESPLELETMSSVKMKQWLNTQISRTRHGLESSCQIRVNFDPANDAEKPLQISQRLMAHALSNALQNAVRFSRENIIVELYSYQGEWILAIEDDGVGIPEDQRERVFDPFSRLDESRQRGSGGFGMGLSIVRKIAQWHQGNAHIADSQNLGGTRVEIRWPIDVEFE